MKVTYIHHSCYLVETKQVLLLFDYVKGELPPLNGDKDLLVFASHRHEDHFSPAVFKLADEHPRIRFILSDDIWQNRVPEKYFSCTEYMDGGTVLELPAGGKTRITAFHSTDEGVAFLVETGGKTIYHAGDLNNWKWNGESKAWNNNMSVNYKRELEKIRDCQTDLDVAMLPLDGRQEEWFYLGVHEFMETIGAKNVFPMHFWGDFDIIRRLKDLEQTSLYRNRVADIHREGESFVI